MASLVSELWVHMTVLIHNDWGERGTGFFVARNMAQDADRLFVVTNKHVLNKDPSLREEAIFVELGLNVYRGGRVVGEQVQWPLHSGDGTALWREHPDEDVDVLAIEVSDLRLQRGDLAHECVLYDAFADQAVIEEDEVAVGDDVVVIGYPPLGLRQGRTNYPLARQGMLASPVGEELIVERESQNGSIAEHSVRGFLVDGATLPGSSGSPVVLKPVMKLAIVADASGQRSRKLARGSSPLLGIIAETAYRPTKTPTGHVSSYTGLGIALEASTIRETVDIFF